MHRCRICYYQMAAKFWSIRFFFNNSFVFKTKTKNKEKTNQKQITKQMRGYWCKRTPEELYESHCKSKQSACDVM